MAIPQQLVSNKTFTTGATSSQAIQSRPGGLVRTQLIITNTSAAAVVTIAKGDVTAVAGNGIQLQPNEHFAEATDGGYLCWQGAVQVVSDVAGSIGITEAFVQETQ